METSGPQIIQGGMGVAISNWRLARAVSSTGQLGVVSGIGIELINCARLSSGDPGGHVRRALEQFPIRDVADRYLDRFFRPEGLPRPGAYLRPEMPRAEPTPERLEVGVLGGFIEVTLAREGHSGLVGLNLLEKARMSNLPVLYGAMLAGVSTVIVGAGVPIRYPAILDAFARHEGVTYPLEVTGAPATAQHQIAFDPQTLFPGIAETAGQLERPRFYAIVSSNVLAGAILKRASGRVDGFVLEHPIAGGHNAPPRGRVSFNEDGEPIYAERDRVDLEKLRGLGLPFWIAGGYGSPGGITMAHAAGAEGVQVGTAFALCQESGMDAELKQRVLDRVLSGTVKVRTDASASPTGFPFKVLQLDGTLSDPDLLEERDRVCDVGLLRECYQDDDGSIGYRCSAEPFTKFERKSGDCAVAERAICLCNALGATAGFAQARGQGQVELPVVTLGNDLACVERLVETAGRSYTASDVISSILGG